MQESKQKVTKEQIKQAAILKEWELYWESIIKELESKS